MVRSHYSPLEYDRARISYPASVFDPARATYYSALSRFPDLLELGAGTGLGSESFVRTQGLPPQIHLTLLEPHPGLVQVGQSREMMNASWVIAPAEDIPAMPRPFGAILVASAWHWFEAARVCEQIEKILAPGGVVLICEYQFPKVVHHDALNEWVRRKFNSVFRLMDQRPRGDLVDLTQSFRAHAQFHQVHAWTEAEMRTWSKSDFLNFLFSQERFLDFEKRQTQAEPVPQKKLDLRLVIAQELEAFFWKVDSLPFRFKFEAILFKKRLI